MRHFLAVQSLSRNSGQLSSAARHIPSSADARFPPLSSGECCLSHVARPPASHMCVMTVEKYDRRPPSPASNAGQKKPPIVPTACPHVSLRCRPTGRSPAIFRTSLPACLGWCSHTPPRSGSRATSSPSGRLSLALESDEHETRFVHSSVS